MAQQTSQKEISVALSDAALALTSFMSTSLLLEKNGSIVDAISFAILGIAATAGVIRFGIYPGFIHVHKFLSRIAAFSIAMISLSIWTFEDGDFGSFKNIEFFINNI